LSIANKAKKYSLNTTDLNVIEFSEDLRGSNISLLPSQKFILKLFDKIPLNDKEKTIEIKDQFARKILRTLTEREYYEFLIDENRISISYDNYYNSEWIQYILAMGRRGSKSTTICLWVAHKLYKLLNIYRPQEYFNIISSDSMCVTLVALGQNNANKLFKKMYGIIKNTAFFKPFLLEKPSSNHLRIWTQYDLDNIKSKSSPGAHSNSMDIFAMPNSPGVRGDNNMFAIMEEFAHYISPIKSSIEKSLDESIYEAMTPSVSGFKNPDGTPFGKTIILSSPNGEKGKFFKEFDSSFKLGISSSSLALRAPTWETNPIVSSIYLEKMYNTSPITFFQEYGADFVKGGDRWIKELGKFYACFDKRLDYKRFAGEFSKKYFLGVDYALSNDGTAMVVSHYEPNYLMRKEDFPLEVFSYNEELSHYFENNESLVSPRIVIDYAEVRYAKSPPWEDHDVLLIDEVLDWTEHMFERWPIQCGIYDQWSGEIINQMLSSRGLKRLEMLNHTVAINDSMYKLFSMCMHQIQLAMPYHPAIEKELLALQVEIRNQGVIKVAAAPGPKNHDDLFSALIRSIYLCYSYIKKNKIISSSLPMLFKEGRLMKDTGAIKNIHSQAQYTLMKKIYHKIDTKRNRDRKNTYRRLR
jgi:hypothetical protein